MAFRATTRTIAVSAAVFSGTLIVPTTYLVASPAAEPQITQTTAVPTPFVLPSVVAEPVAAPAPPTPPPTAATILPVPRAQVAPAPAARAERTAPVQHASSSELDCMTRVILYEAGAEPRTGQVAVAQVVLNRMRSGRFPRSICGVIYQRGQFSSIRSFNPPRNGRWQRAMALGREVISGSAPVVGNALYFHATRVRPAFAASRTRVARIGGHVFYR